MKGSELSALPLGLELTRPAAKLARLQLTCPGFVEEARAAILAARQRHHLLSHAHLPRPPPDGRGSDLGTAPSHTSQRLEVLELAKSGGGTVRRAQVADRVARMVARGELQARHSQAASLLRVLVEESHPPSSSPLSRIGAPRGSGGENGDAVLRAAQAHRELDALWRACWPYAQVVAWVVVGGGTLDAFAATFRVRRVDVATWLRCGLEASATHFGIV